MAYACYQAFVELSMFNDSQQRIEVVQLYLLIVILIFRHICLHKVKEINKMRRKVSNKMIMEKRIINGDKPTSIVHFERTFGQLFTKQWRQTCDFCKIKMMTHISGQMVNIIIKYKQKNVIFPMKLGSNLLKQLPLFFL